MLLYTVTLLFMLNDFWFHFGFSSICYWWSCDDTRYVAVMNVLSASPLWRTRAILYRNTTTLLPFYYCTSRFGFYHVHYRRACSFSYWSMVLLNCMSRFGGIYARLKTILPFKYSGSRFGGFYRHVLDKRCSCDASLLLACYWNMTLVPFNLKSLICA